MQLLRHQGVKLQVEHDFALCSLILSLEGWEGLDIFGGNYYFLRNAGSFLQGVALMKDASNTSISSEQLDLAHVSLPESVREGFINDWLLVVILSLISLHLSWT